jgi:DNA repair exonuclease SbcCD ATPase subunit
MILKRLTAKNVFKFDKIDITFKEGTYIILASTNGNFSQSNGVGKSAVLELVVFALFGETIRGLNDISKNHTEKFEVTLEFDDKKITRNQSKVKFEMNGAEPQIGRKTEMQKMISNIIKLDKQMLQFTHIFDSDDTFFKLDDSDKKNVLMKLINVDFLDALYDKVKDVADELKKKRHDNTIEIFKEEVKDIDGVAQKEKKAHADLMAVQGEEENIRKYITYKRDLDARLPKYVDLIKSIRSQRKKLSALKTEVESFKVKEVDTDKLKKCLQNLTENIGKYKGKIDSLKQKKVKLQTTDACPVFEDFQCDKLTLEHKKSMLESLEIEMQGIVTEMSVDVADKTNAEAGIREADRATLKYNELKSDFDGGKKVYKADKERAEQLKEEIRALVDTNKDVRKYKDCKISLQDIRIKQMEFADIQAKYKMMLDKQKKLGELIEKNDLVKKQMLEMEVIKKIFGKDGLKQFAVSKIVSFLQTEINNMLSRIFPNMTVNIITDFDVDKKNMLKIKITRNGHESEMKEFSKGERRIFEIVFQIGMYRLFSKFSQQYISVMFFDEIFDPIDDHNKNIVTDILGLLENEDKTIFVISHDKNMKQYFDKVMVVDSDGDNSWLKATVEEEV